MKVRIRIFWYFVLFLAGCKDEKSVPLPVLEMVEGTATRGVQVPDTLRFTVKASDEEGLARLRVELASTGANFAPLSPPLIYPLSGKSQTIAVAYPITDTLLDDGNYQLVVRLESQREYSQLFIPVNVVGVPRQVTGLCFLAVSGNSSRVYRSGPDFVLPPNPSVWPLAVQYADYQAALGQIWAAGGGSPTAYRYQLPTDLLIAGTNAQTALGFPLFTALQLDRNQVFLGRGAGSIWWANGDGSGARQHVLPEGFYPGAMAVSGNRILYDMLPYDPTGLPRIRLIDREREGLIREIPRNGRLVAAHRLNDDQWLLLIEANGKGELFRYTTSLSRLESETGPDNRHFRQLLAIPDGSLILLHDQTSQYRPGTTVRTGQFTTLSTDSFSFVSHDPLGNRLLGISGQQAKLIPLNGGSMPATIQLPEAMRMGWVLRNR